MENPGSSDASPADRVDDTRPRPTPLWALLSRWLLATEAWLRSHGGARLRWTLRGGWALVAAVGVLLLVGPVINPPLTLDDLLDSAESATDSWIAREFDAAYTLLPQSDGRLDAEVTETITALFPDDLDQSTIERTLPTQYEGHDLRTEIIEVTLDGVAVTPAVRDTGDQLRVQVDAGRELSGEHTLVLRYRLHDLAFSGIDAATGRDADLVEWSVLGPDWPHGMAVLNVSVTLPDHLDSELVRSPRGAAAWSLVGGGEWLESEADSPPSSVTYAFTLEQNMPPHSQAWFTLVFPAGTIAMPPPSPLFLVQSFGPLVPLAVLLVSLLFALAARAVAWSDARGRPWYVAQHDPPEGVDVRTAAQLLGAVRTRELALAIDRLGGGRRTEHLAAVGRAAARTGRFGDRFRAAAAFRLDPARGAQLREGYRRIPRGFVRDAFLSAPPALSLLQLGLIRQLSHQATLAIVWWPVAFVALSLVLTAAIFWIALSARPLTRRGALVRQHLLGVRLQAERTELIARSPLTDRGVPYAVLTGDPRPTGEVVFSRVADELGADDLRRWRTRDFLTWPRLLVRALAVFVVIGAVAVIAIVPNPYERGGTSASWDFAAAGTLYTQVSAVDIAARIELVAGEPVLVVTERVDVTFEEGAARVPQFAQRFPAEVDGQDIGFEVAAVRVDGDAVDYTASRVGAQIEVSTALPRVLEGEHTVEIAYAIEHPVTVGVGSPVSGHDEETVQRIRWSALLDGWESGWAHPSAPSARVSIAIPDDLAQTALSAGWLREDPDTAEEARDWRESGFPFGTAVEELERGLPDSDASGTLTEEQIRDGSVVTHLLETAEGEYGYPTSGTYSDLGVLLEFPAGSFTVDRGGWTQHRLSQVFPIVLIGVLAGAALALAVLAAVVVGVRRSRRFPSGTFREAMWVLPPAFAVAALIVFFWATADMPSDWREFPALAVGALTAIVASVAGWILVRPEASRARALTGVDVTAE